MFEVGKKYVFVCTGSAPPVPHTCLAIYKHYVVVVSEVGCPYILDTRAGTSAWTEYREPARVSGWVNVYKSQNFECWMHQSKEKALERVNQLRSIQPNLDYITTVYVSGEEGKEP
jgi:hypothetical protein